jgi:trans-aconitate 2-methyltransferase
VLRTSATMFQTSSAGAAIGTVTDACIATSLVAGITLTVRVTDWSGQDYSKISSLQRAMIEEAMASLVFADGDRVLDVGCGDGHLTHEMARMVSSGCAIGVDPSKRMIATAHAAGAPTMSGPWFVIADARRLPFGEHFDVVVSFNALHWVPEQQQALRQIASVLRPGGYAVIQVVCAGERQSLEEVAMQTCRSPGWASLFDGFAAPFVHVEADAYGELAASAGLTLTNLTVTDREWNYGSRTGFRQWCAVGTTAWTDRLPVEDRGLFVDALVDAYEPVAGRTALFRFTQMRAELRR